MSKELIEEYARGADLIRQAIAGMNAEQMAARPVPGRWSTHEVLVHLQDAESALADRIRRIIAEDDPVLMAWDENRFVERLSYDAQSADDAIALIELIRRQLARTLRTLDPGVLDRTGRHSEVGPITARACLEKANSHLRHHLDFVKAKREALGL